MKNILNKLSNVIIIAVVALIVYCICVPRPAHATTTCKDAVKVNTYSYNNNFVEVFNDGSRIVTYNNEHVIEKYNSNNNVIYSYNIKADNIKVIDEYYKQDGSKLILLNNTSFAYIDTKANKYEFTVYEMGDWSISFKSEKELRAYIKSYSQFHKTRIEADKKIGEFKPVTTLNIDGNITTIYNDGSKLEGVNGEYTFIPCLAYDNKGIKLDNENDCKNCINTYKSIKESGNY